MRYQVENWKQLGEWVAAERRAQGYIDTNEWASRVGRSTRMVLGLERGEPVGDKTLEAVAEALDVLPSNLYAILVGGAAGAGVKMAGVGTLQVGGPRVGGTPEDADTLLFKRPEGLSDEAWERLRAEQEDYWQWLLDRASRER